MNFASKGFLGRFRPGKFNLVHLGETLRPGVFDTKEAIAAWGGGLHLFFLHPAKEG